MYYSYVRTNMILEIATRLNLRRKFRNYDESYNFLEICQYITADVNILVIMLIIYGGPLEASKTK